MQRRELIKMITVLTGGSVIGADLFLTGCKNNTASDFFTKDDIAFFDEVAETIIPKTNTPGAKEAATGSFMALYATDCYDEPTRKVFKDGIAGLNSATEKMYHKRFMEINAAQQKDMLTAIDREAKLYDKQSNGSKEQKPPHYFTLMKQLTLLGFFSSKSGATQVLRYNPVPGKYEGCIDYKKGETSWY